MAEIETLDDINEWQRTWEALRAENAAGVLIFKRSPTCPVSHSAEREFDEFAGALPASKNLRLVRVDVIGARPISQRIAADTKIKHESPQALLLGHGQTVLWHASHGDITHETLAQALG